MSDVICLSSSEDEDDASIKHPETNEKKNSKQNSNHSSKRKTSVSFNMPQEKRHKSQEEKSSTDTEFLSKPGTSKESIQIRSTIKSKFSSPPSTSQQSNTIRKVIKPVLIVKEKVPIPDPSDNIFEKFLETCTKKKDDKDTIKILKNLKKKFNHLQPSDRDSDEFRLFLNKSLQKVLDGNIKFYNILIEVNEEISRRNKKPAVSESEQNSNETMVEESREEGEIFLSEDDMKKVKKLEKLIERCKKKIKELESQEVDFDDEDDSCYMQEDKYKRKLIELYETLNKIVGDKKIKRAIYRKHLKRSDITDEMTGITSVDESIIKMINSYIHKLNKLKHIRNYSAIADYLPMPDYHDILQCIIRCNDQRELYLSKKKMEQLARNAFKSIGNYLKKQRVLESSQYISSYVEDKTETDPAARDVDLNEKLRINKTLGDKKLEEIFKKYVDVQEGLPPEDLADQSTDQNTATDSEDEIENHTKNNKKHRKMCRIESEEDDEEDHKEQKVDETNPKELDQEKNENNIKDDKRVLVEEKNGNNIKDDEKELDQEKNENNIKDDEKELKKKQNIVTKNRINRESDKNENKLDCSIESKSKNEKNKLNTKNQENENNKDSDESRNKVKEDIDENRSTVEIDQVTSSISESTAENALKIVSEIVGIENISKNNESINHTMEVDEIEILSDSEMSICNEQKSTLINEKNDDVISIMNEEDLSEDNFELKLSEDTLMEVELDDPLADETNVSKNVGAKNSNVCILNNNQSKENKNDRCNEKTKKLTSSSTNELLKENSLIAENLIDDVLSSSVSEISTTKIISKNVTEHNATEIVETIEEVSEVPSEAVEKPEAESKEKLNNPVVEDKTKTETSLSSFIKVCSFAKPPESWKDSPEKVKKNLGIPIKDALKGMSDPECVDLTDEKDSGWNSSDSRTLNPLAINKRFPVNSMVIVKNIMSNSNVPMPTHGSNGTRITAHKIRATDPKITITTPIIKIINNNQRPSNMVSTSIVRRPFVEKRNDKNVNKPPFIK